LAKSRIDCRPWPCSSKSCEGIFDLSKKAERLQALNAELERPGFWDRPEQAQPLLKERTALEREIARFSKEERALAQARELLELAREEGEESILPEIDKSIEQIEKALGAMELSRMFGGKNDRLGAIVSINPGAGGTESQDWAEMLLRMYLRWCERHEFPTELVEYQAGEEAGIKSATFLVNGEWAYGYFQAEIGIHRLVRISPFDANARRHTSFASVFAIPQVDDEIVVVVDEADLRVDTFRSGGAGGQHVNKTDSAVRITHLPTGIVVVCQSERSQHKNKSTAMKILRSRLYERQLQEKEKELEALHGQKKEAAFGSQIRSYVLHPYRLVKDHRTDMETSNADAVLDGDLDEFIRAYLLKRAGGSRA
jgi:peptide chain release factor 2